MPRPASALAERALGDIADKWGWLMLAGVLMVILGVAALQMEVGLTLTAMMILGGMSMVAGLITIATTFRVTGWKSKIWHLLVGLGYLVVGLVMLTDPGASAAWFTLVIAAFLVVTGILRIISAFVMRHVQGWFLTLLSGVAALLLGVMIMMQWPVSGLWVIGMFIAIDFILQGISFISTAWAARSYKQTQGQS